MKRSFWNINFYVCTSGHRTPDVTFFGEMKPCLTESDASKRFFKQFFDVTLTDEIFFSLKVLFLKERKMSLFSHNWQLFFFSSSHHICDQLLWTCPQKNICIANWNYCFWKEDLKVKAKRRRNRFRQKRFAFGIFNNIDET